MAYSHGAQIVGNLAYAPELRTMSDGKAMTFLKIMVNEGQDDKERSIAFDVAVFGQQAENAVESFDKGTRVLAFLTASNRTIEVCSGKFDEDGNPEIVERQTVSFTATHLGAAITFATVDIKKNARKGARSVDEDAIEAAAEGHQARKVRRPAAAEDDNEPEPEEEAPRTRRATSKTASKPASRRAPAKQQEADDDDF